LDNQQLLIAQGYDHNWVLGSSGPKLGGLRLAARAWDLASGRELTVWTDQPGAQFYSGNFLNGTLVGISSHIYRPSAGYTFETQALPELAEPAQLPVHEAEARAGRQLHEHLPVQHRLTGGRTGRTACQTGQTAGRPGQARRERGACPGSLPTSHRPTRLPAW
jgi:Aldose 1-epimerase